MKILGIDPGYDRLGIAVIEKTSGLKGGQVKDTLLYSSCFTTSAKDPIYQRLGEVGKEIGRTMERYKPDVLALETLFITKNQKTGMRVAEARGIIMYEAIKRNIPISEYSPMQIKMAATGDGSSDKTRMMKMIRLLISMTPKTSVPKLDDEYDAIAVALTHSALTRLAVLRT